mmetsp:Transcript_11775/g.16308  ORF Transcript_11775/g.16308 Transcript_11775/m.16308 type:complete len:111 (+) Transcript_11775:275-607(+)
MCSEQAHQETNCHIAKRPESLKLKICTPDIGIESDVEQHRRHDHIHTCVRSDLGQFCAQVETWPCHACSCTTPQFSMTGKSEWGHCWGAATFPGLDVPRARIASARSDNC